MLISRRGHEEEDKRGREKSKERTHEGMKKGRTDD